MHDRRPSTGLAGREFVAFVAALMAVNALGVDLMLPALADLGHELGVVTANHRQWVVTSYMLGFGTGQLVYGPIADRWGRRPVLLATLAGFVVASVFAASATTFGALLGARVLQGLMSASTRTLSVTIVRDRYEGRRMARIMSIAQMIFFVVPILAPTLGQLLLGVGPWRFVFYALATFGATVGAWAAVRLPETLPRDFRVPLSSLPASLRLILTNRASIGYAVAASMTFGGIIAFVSTAQQIFVDEFHAGRRFVLLFAACAFTMGCASFANSRLVERLGTRRISQTALVALIGLSAVHLVVIASGHEALPIYLVFQALSMGCIGLCGANFGAMAMESVGRVAGTASSIQGCITSVGAVAIASVIGQSYDGTTRPLAIGYLCIGLGALATVAWIERGRLFRPHVTPAPRGS